jgi:putative sterol carrier protein
MRTLLQAGAVYSLASERPGGELATTDPIAEFMDDLAARGNDPSLANATGTVRFDVVDGKRTERWLVTVTKGALDVSRRNARADAVVRGPRPIFERLVRGKANATAAFLRGALTLEGDLGLLVLVQRLFPREKGAQAKGRAAGWAARQR